MTEGKREVNCTKVWWRPRNIIRKIDLFDFFEVKITVLIDYKTFIHGLKPTRTPKDRSMGKINGKMSRLVVLR